VQRRQDGWVIRFRPPYAGELEASTADLRNLLAYGGRGTADQRTDGGIHELHNGALIQSAIRQGFLISTEYEVRGKTARLSPDEIEGLRRSIKPQHLAMLEVESVLLYLLARENPFAQPICELGTLYGGSTIALALAARRSVHRNRIMAVDDHEWHKHLPESSVDPEHIRSLPTTLGIFRENLKDAGLTDGVDIYLDDTAWAANRYDGQISMLVVDAGHRRDEIERDVQAWLPKVAPGGIVAFHDYGSPTWPDVKIVVDELKHLFAAFCQLHEFAIGIKR
jgi:predicted O-methyltransferase YrrM